MAVAGPISMGPAPGLSSAAGLISMLEETEVQLQTTALRSLNKVIDTHWAEVAGSISVIEAMYEDEFFAQRELAALLASKVFYHLGELNDALNYALCAGSMFDVTESNDFVKTLLAKAIDEYIEQRQKPEAEQAIDARLVSIVERMFQRCFDDGQIHQAIGVALETKRLDKLEEAIHKSTDVAEALNYATRVCQTLVTSREFRREVLTVLVRMYESDHVENNYLNVCQCLMFLDDADGVAAILTRLVEGEEDDQLLAYQIAFSLCENEIQKFLSNVASKLAPSPKDTPRENGADEDAAMEDGEEDKKEDEEKKTEEKKTRRRRRRRRRSPSHCSARCSPGSFPSTSTSSFCTRTTPPTSCCSSRCVPRWSRGTPCATPRPCSATR